MKFLAISGSARQLSTNTALLKAVAEIGKPQHDITVFSEVADLPVFSPDNERHCPANVERFARQIRDSDGLLIASPEYVRAIPGGLKNALDWLVSRDEIIAKPIALLHASHRGDDVLKQLRLVLSTVSECFCTEIFLRVPLLKHAPKEVRAAVLEPDTAAQVRSYLSDFAQYCANKSR